MLKVSAAHLSNFRLSEPLVFQCEKVSLLNLTSINQDHDYQSSQLLVPTSSDAVQNEQVNLDHDYLASCKYQKRKTNNALKRRLKTHLQTVPLMKENKLIAETELPMFQGAKLRCVLSKTRDIKKIVKTFLSIPHVKQAIIDDISVEIGSVPETMRNKKKGFISVLMKKDTDHLQSVNFGLIVSEMKRKFPVLLQMLQSIMIPDSKREEDTFRASLIPKLALIYGIVMQSRCHELSLMQRLVAMTLADNRCDQAVSYFLIAMTIFLVQFKILLLKPLCFDVLKVSIIPL